VTPPIPTYFDTLQRLLTEVQRDEADNIDRAARMIATAIGAGGQVKLLGTGHSYALAIELAGRAGGLMDLAVIHDAVLSMTEGLGKSTATERLGGYGAILIEQSGLRAGDVLVVISNSGRNAVPVEALLAAQGRGVGTVALTSVAHSRSTPPRPPAPGRLCDLADIVLDNHGLPGDAAVAVAGVAHPLGPTSTVVGAAILNAVSMRAAELLVESGQQPAVYLSANV